MEAHTALTEFLINGKTHFVYQKLDREKVEILLINDDLSCYRGVAAVATIKPEGFRKGAYIEILKNALKVQDSSGESFSYEIKEGKRDTLKFSVLFKVQDGHIFVKGAEFILKLVTDKSAAITEFLRKLAILSGGASAAMSEVKTLKHDRERFRALTDEAAQQRLKSEESMLTGMVWVLNEKKSKLKEFADDIEAVERDKKLLESIVENKDKKMEKMEAEVSQLKAELSKTRIKLNVALMADPVSVNKTAAGTKRTYDESADSYPDFTTIAAVASPDVKKQLFASPVRQVGRQTSDVSRTSVGSRVHSTKKPRRSDGSNDETRNDGLITVHDLLDSD